MGILRSIIGVILLRLSDWLMKPIRKSVEEEVAEYAEQDQRRRRTAGEIAADAEARAQEQREERFNKANAEEKLEELKRGFGPKRNNWV